MDRVGKELDGTGWDGDGAIHGPEIWDLEEATWATEGTSSARDEARCPGDGTGKGPNGPQKGLHGLDGAEWDWEGATDGAGEALHGPEVELGRDYMQGP